MDLHRRLPSQQSDVKPVSRHHKTLRLSFLTGESQGVSGCLRGALGEDMQCYLRVADVFI